MRELRPGWPQVDPQTLATTAPGVFVAGDLAHGTRLLIDAVASGKRAARSVYRHVTGRTIAMEALESHVPIAAFRREPGYEMLRRAAIPVRDTVKQADDPGRDGSRAIRATISRDTIFLAQTPQAFRADLLREAHEKARRDGVVGTDDAALVERLGHVVKVVRGLEANLKITTPEDLRRARRLAARSQVAPGAGHPRPKPASRAPLQ